MANLFDALFNFNRTGVQNGIMNQDARNALLTENTRLAMQRAQENQDALQATQHLGMDLQQATGPDGKPMYTPSQAALYRDEEVGKYGNASAIAAQDNTGTIDALRNTVAAPDTDPNTRLFALDALSARAQSPNTPVDGQLVQNLLPNAATDPTVVQTPVSQAAIAGDHALGALRSDQAAATSHAALALKPWQRAGFRVAAQNYLYGHVQPLTSMFGNGPNKAALANYFWDVVGHLSIDPGWHDPAMVLDGDAAPGTPPAAGVPAPGAPPAPAAPAPAAPAPGAPSALAPLNYAIVPMAEQGYRQFMSGPPGQSVRGYATVAKTIPVVQSAIAALHNGSFVPGNAAVQEVSRLFGSPAPTNMALVPQYFGTEVMRALRGSGAFPESELNKLQQSWSVAASTGQLDKAVAETEQMVNAGRAGLQAQYDAAVRNLGGRVAGIPSFDSLLSDNGAISDPGAAPAGASPSYPQPTPAALNLLHSNPALAPMFQAKFGYLPPGFGAPAAPGAQP